MTAPRFITRGLAPLVVALVAWALIGPATAAFAQTSRVALDTVIAVDAGAGSQVTRKPTAWFDVFGAVRLAEGLNLRAPGRVPPRVRRHLAIANLRAGPAV